MKHACLISYSHHTFKNPKIVVIWIDKEGMTTIQDFFEKARVHLAKLEGFPTDEIALLDTSYLGASVDTVVTYMFDESAVFKALPGTVMYEVREDLPLPIHWTIESVAMKKWKVTYKLVNNRTGGVKTINSDDVNTSTGTGFYTRKDQAFKICESIREAKKGE